MTEKKSNVKSNFIYQICYQVLILALPFVMSPYVSRVLGADGLGRYSYSYSVAYYFVLFSMVGILNYGNRAIAKCRNDRDMLNREFSGLVTLHIMISGVCTVLYLIYTIFIAKEQLYAITQIAYVLSGLFDITWFYYGIEKFKLTVARNTIIKILTVVLVFMLVREKNDVWVYCVIMSGSMLLSQLTLWVPLKKYVSYVRPSKDDTAKHLKPMMLLFIPTIAISLYKYMDKIMIGILSDKTELGYYENAESLTRVLNTIIGSLGTVMLPQMSNLVANNKMDQFFKYISVSMRYIMVMAFGMSFGLAGIAKTFAPFFWGDDFIRAGEIIQWLVITVPFVSFANVIRTQYLLPKEKDIEYMTSVIAGAAVNLVINAVLIPVYGAVGASVATVFAEMTVCIVQMFAVRKELPVFRYVKDSLPYLLFGIVMYLSVYGLSDKLDNQVLGICLQVVVGIVVYTIPTVMTLYVKKDETLIKMVEKAKGRY
jgi:O-antigen/teichoic acid export membrane protein